MTNLFAFMFTFLLVFQAHSMNFQDWKTPQKFEIFKVAKCTGSCHSILPSVGISFDKIKTMGILFAKKEELGCNDQSGFLLNLFLYSPESNGLYYNNMTGYKSPVCSSKLTIQSPHDLILTAEGLHIKIQITRDGFTKMSWVDAKKMIDVELSLLSLSKNQ